MGFDDADADAEATAENEVNEDQAVEQEEEIDKDELEVLKVTSAPAPKKEEDKEGMLGVRHGSYISALLGGGGLLGGLSRKRSGGALDDTDAAKRSKLS